MLCKPVVLYNCRFQQQVELVLFAGRKQLGHIKIRVSNNSDITEHTAECATWDEYDFPDEIPYTLQCDQTMVGQYVSIQRTDGNQPHVMALCEVEVYGHEAYSKRPCDIQVLSFLDCKDAENSRR